MAAKLIPLRNFVLIGLVAYFQLGLSPCAAATNGSEVVDGEHKTVTPTPLDVNRDLKPLYFGSKSDYFISTFAADVSTARQVCQNLTSLTGKHFRLLMLEDKDEMNELKSYLEALELPGIWLGGEKTFNDEGTIAVYWVTAEGLQPMEFRNFRNGAPLFRRRMREIEDLSSEESSEAAWERVSILRNSSSTSVSSLYPWFHVGRNDGQRCRNAKFLPEGCKPGHCNVTLPDCTTERPPCLIRNDTDCKDQCTAQRPQCDACDNCTVTPPVCYAKQANCTVTTEPCQILSRGPCTVTTPPCTTKRPPCKTTQPPCEVLPPPPCTTKRPCIPTFRKDNCTTVKGSCKTNSKNETVCEPERTVCEEAYRCPPPESCHSAPIICPPPLIYCPPEEINCPSPTYDCPPPITYCPDPKVVCPEPEIVCSAPQAVCTPTVNCPGIIVTCGAPDLDCPPPKVTCPEPIAECSEPEPCLPPESPLPPCEDPEPTTTTTTQSPCRGCGCVFLSQKHQFQWDIASCATKNHFICEGSLD